MTEPFPTPSPRSLIGRQILVDPFAGGPRMIRVDAEVLRGPYTDLWKATDPSGKVWGLRMLPAKEVHAMAWVQVMRIGGIQHPNIARVMGRVSVDDVRGLVREWVDGQPLDSLWAPNASIADVEQVFRSILSAVAEAHRHSVVHGGLKPSRVMLDRRGDSLKVLDFATGPWLPPRPEDGPWLAPERREVFEPDERSDIYALGAMLYWLATGVAPDRSPVPVRKLRPDLPEGLRQAIERAMHPDRNLRTPSCGLLQDLVGGDGGVERADPDHSFPKLEDALEADGTEEKTVDEVWAESGSAGGMGRIPTERPPRLTPPPTSALPPRVPDADSSVKKLENLEKPPVPPPSPGNGVRLLALVAVGLILLTSSVLLWLHFNAVPPVQPNVVPPPPPPVHTVNTVFEFAGSTQPDSVVITCEQAKYQEEVPVTRGRALVRTIPNVEGCTMYPAGVTVQQAMPVTQGFEYHCTIDRAVLSCAGNGASPSH